LHRGQATCHAQGSNQTAAGARHFSTVARPTSSLASADRSVVSRDVEIGGLLATCQTLLRHGTMTVRVSTGAEDQEK
jgi:hypothetical protein